VSAFKILIVIDKLKKIASNSFVSNYLKVFSVDVLVKGSGIILLPIYLKLMTQEEFGMYGYLLAIIGTFSLVFNLGIYAAQSKFYHDYSDQKRGEMLFTLNILLLIFNGCLISAVLIFGIDHQLVEFLFKEPINYARYRPIVLLSVIVSVYSFLIVNFLLTSEDIRKVQFFNISRILLVNGIVLVILFLGHEQDHVYVRLTGATLVEVAIILFFSFEYVSKMKFHFDFDIAKKALTIGFPIVVSAIIGIFINLSDRYFIDKHGTLKDMSVYNLALSISGVIPFVFASFQNIWIPQFLKEKDYQVNQAKSKKMIFRLSIAFVLLSVAIMFALKIMLVFNIISRKYDTIMLVLPISLLTGIVTSLTGVFSFHLLYLNKLFLIIIIGIPLAFLGIALNNKLVPLYNIYGAAVSSLVLNLCYLISYVLMVDFLYKRKAKIDKARI